MHPTVGYSLATIILDERRAEAEATRLAAAAARGSGTLAALRDGLSAVRAAFSYPAEPVRGGTSFAVPQLRDYPYAR
jgi:hypothetical protein